jgi:hypothetical protein
LLSGIAMFSFAAKATPKESVLLSPRCMFRQPLLKRRSTLPGRQA